MEFKVIYTKFFNGCLRALDKQGQRKSVQAVRAAISEAGMNGEIRLPRTSMRDTFPLIDLTSNRQRFFWNSRYFGISRRKIGNKLGLSPEAQELAAVVLGSDYKREAEGLLERLDQLAGYEKATLVFDLFILAHAGDWAALQRRLNIVTNEAAVNSTLRSSVSNAARPE